jgi:hypothetical protein
MSLLVTRRHLHLGHIAVLDQCTQRDHHLIDDHGVQPGRGQRSDAHRGSISGVGLAAATSTMASRAMTPLTCLPST